MCGFGTLPIEAAMIGRPTLRPGSRAIIFRISLGWAGH